MFTTGMQRDPKTEAYFAKPTHRIMVFVDGENLVFRYQEMLRRGYVPRDDLLFYEPDVAVWSPTFTHLAEYHEIFRVTYYTYVVGDEGWLNSVRETIRRQTFNKHMASLLPNSLTPRIFRMTRRAEAARVWIFSYA